MNILLTMLFIALSFTPLFSKNNTIEELPILNKIQNNNEQDASSIDKEIYYLSATYLIQAMKSGELSALEVMEKHLNRIGKINPLLNGLVQQLPKEECLKQALQADQKRINGLKLGKLHGLPITIKDTHLVKGFVSCMGCILQTASNFDFDLCESSRG